MTEHEIKILKHLNKSRSQNNVDEVLSEELEITTHDIKIAVEALENKKYIYQDSKENQKNSGLRAWKITENGQIKINELKRIEDLEKENEIKKNELDLNKMGLTGKDTQAKKKSTSNFWTSKSVIWVVIPIVLTLMYGAYQFGFDRGYVKYDKEKINLQKTVDSLSQEIKELEETESSELKSLKIENKNIWDTYHKLLEENEQLKKKK